MRTKIFYPIKNDRHQHYMYLRLTSLMRKVWEERGGGALNFVARVIRCVLDVIFTTTETSMFRIYCSLPYGLTSR